MTKKVLQLQRQINNKLNKGKKNKAKKRILLSLIVLCIVLVGLGFIWFYRSRKNDTKLAAGNSWESYDFKISFLDVGEGNACLIQCEDEAMLIDTGYYGQLEKLKGYLQDNGILHLKYLVATHPDADHIGSMGYVITNFLVDKVLMSDATNDTSAYHKMLEAIDLKNLPVDIPDYGQEYSLGGASVKVLSSKKEYDEVNDYSLVLKISYEDESFLITGDASTLVEKELIKKKDIKSDVLLLGHHGSSDSSSEEFLKKVNPAEVVISCGKDNDYGHPHKEVLNLLKKRKINYYRTDEVGTIAYGIKKGDKTLYRLWEQ